MPARQTLPRQWLMTDRSLGDALWQALGRLPAGGGVVLRHHACDLALGLQVADTCQRRGLMLAVAGDVGFARRLGAAMVHNPAEAVDGMMTSRSVHGQAEALAAVAADLVFVSPVHPTGSHPGAAGLGLEAALDLARMAGAPAIALGGMDAVRGKQAIAAGFHGWAAISAWARRAPLAP